MEIPIHVEWIRKFLKDKLQSFSSQNYNSRSITPQVYAILCQYRTLLNSTNMAPFCNHCLYSLSLYAINQNYDFENSSFQKIQTYLQNTLGSIDFSFSNLDNSSNLYFDEYDKLASSIMHLYLVSIVLPSTISPGILGTDLDSYEDAFEKWVKNQIENKHSFFKADFLYDVTSAQSISIILAKIRPDLIRIDQVTFGPSISKTEIQKNWQAAEFAIMALGIRRLESSDRLCVLCFLADLFVVVSEKLSEVSTARTPVMNLNFHNQNSNDLNSSNSFYSRLQKLDMLLDKVNELAYRREVPKEPKKEPVLFKPVKVISSIMQPPIKSNQNIDDNKKKQIVKPTIVMTDNFENELQIIRPSAAKKKNYDSSFLDSENDDSFIDAKNIPQRIIKQNAIKRKIVKTNSPLNKKKKDPKEDSISYSEQRSLFKDLEQIMKNKSEPKDTQTEQTENKKQLPIRKIIPAEPPKTEDELYSKYQISKQLKEKRQKIISKKKQKPRAEIIEEDTNIRKKQFKEEASDSDFEYQEEPIKNKKQLYKITKKENDLEIRRKKTRIENEHLQKQIQYQEIEEEEEEYEYLESIQDVNQKMLAPLSSSSSVSPSPKKNDKGSYYENYMKRKELLQKSNQTHKKPNKSIADQSKKNHNSNQNSIEINNEEQQLSKKKKPNQSSIEIDNEEQKLSKKKKPNQSSIEIDNEESQFSKKNKQNRVIIQPKDDKQNRNKVQNTKEDKSNIAEIDESIQSNKKVTSPKRSKIPLKVKTPKKSTLAEMLNDNEANEIKQKHQLYKNMVTNLDDSNDLQFSNNSNIIPYQESTNTNEKDDTSQQNKQFKPLLENSSLLPSENSKSSSFFRQKEEIENIEGNSKSETINQGTRSSIKSFLEIERMTLNQPSSSSMKNKYDNDNSPYSEEEIEDDYSITENENKITKNNQSSSSNNEYEYKNDESNLSQIPSDIENDSFSQNEQSSIISENRDDHNDTIETLEILSNSKSEHSNINEQPNNSPRSSGNSSIHSSMNRERNKISTKSPNHSINNESSKNSTNYSMNDERSNMSSKSKSNSINKERSNITMKLNHSINNGKSQISTKSNESMRQNGSKISANSPNNSRLSNNSSFSKSNKSIIIDQLNQFDDILPGFDDSDDFQDPLIAFGSKMSQISSSDILNKVLSTSPDESDRKLLSIDEGENDKQISQDHEYSIEDDKHQSNKLISNDQDYPSFSIEEDENDQKPTNQPIQTVDQDESENYYSYTYSYSNKSGKDENNTGQSYQDSIKSNESASYSNSYEIGKKNEDNSSKQDKSDKIIRFSNEDDEDALPSLIESIKDSSSENNEDGKEKSGNYYEYTKSNYYYSSKAYSYSIEEEEEDLSDSNEHINKNDPSYSSDEKHKENQSTLNEKETNEIKPIIDDNTEASNMINSITNETNNEIKPIINDNTEASNVINSITNETNNEINYIANDSNLIHDENNTINSVKDEMNLPTDKNETISEINQEQITSNENEQNKTEIIDFSLYDSFDKTENEQNNDELSNKTNNSTELDSINKTENNQSIIPNENSQSQSNPSNENDKSSESQLDKKDQSEIINGDLNKEKIKSSDVYSESLLGLSISSSGMANSDFLKDPKSPTVILTEAPITDPKTLPITNLSNLHEPKSPNPTATTTPVFAPEMIDSKTESDLFLSINPESAVNNDKETDNKLNDLTNQTNENANSSSQNPKLSLSHNSISNNPTQNSSSNTSNLIQSPNLNSVANSLNQPLDSVSNLNDNQHDSVQNPKSLTLNSNQMNNFISNTIPKNSEPVSHNSVESNQINLSQDLDQKSNGIQNDSIEKDDLTASNIQKDDSLLHSTPKSNLSMSLNSLPSPNKTQENKLSLTHNSAMNQSQTEQNDGLFNITTDDNTVNITLTTDNQSKSQSCTEFINNSISAPLNHDDQIAQSINNLNNTEPSPSKNTYSDSIPFKVLNDDQKETTLDSSEKVDHKSNTYHITPISSNILNSSITPISSNITEQKENETVDEQKEKEMKSLQSKSPLFQAPQEESKLAKTYNANKNQLNSSIAPIEFGDEFLLHQNSLFDMSPVKSPTKEMETLTKVDTSLHDENEISEIEAIDNSLKKSGLSLISDNSIDLLNFSDDENSPKVENHSSISDDKANSSEMNSSDRDELFNSVMTIPSESLSSYSKRSTEPNSIVKTDLNQSKGSELKDLTLSSKSNHDNIANALSIRNEKQQLNKSNSNTNELSINQQTNSNTNDVSINNGNSLSINNNQQQLDQTNNDKTNDLSILDTGKLPQFDSDSDEGNIQISGEVVISDDDEKEIEVELPSNRTINKNHSKSISGSLEFTDNVKNGLDSVKILSEIAKDPANDLNTKQSTLDFTNDVKQGLDSIKDIENDSLTSKPLTVSSPLDFSDDVKKGLDSSQSLTIDSISKPIDVTSPIDFTDDVKKGLNSSQSLTNDTKSNPIKITSLIDSTKSSANEPKSNPIEITSPTDSSKNQENTKNPIVATQTAETYTSTTMTSDFGPPKFIDSSKIEMISPPDISKKSEKPPPRPPVTDEPTTLDSSISKLPSQNTSTKQRVTFDPSVIRMSQKDERRMIHNQQFQPIFVAPTPKEQKPPKPLTPEEKELIHRYVHEAHGVNKSKYQYLSGLEEKALFRVLPRASEMSQVEIYEAIANNLQIQKNDPITHKIVSNLNVFIGRSNEKVDLMSKTSSVKIPDSVIEEEEYDDDEYF